MTKDEIMQIAESYRADVRMTIGNADLPSETAEVIDEIARQTYYAISQLCEAVSELK